VAVRRPGERLCLRCGVDALFQPSAYWGGDFEKVQELSQPDRWMLMQHPLLFVAWVLVWIIGFSGAILLLPVRAGLVISITLILGNASGASSWIIAQLPGGFWLGYGMFVMIALLLGTWSKAGVLKDPASGGRAVP
jgi:hypothetical protein